MWDLIAATQVTTSSTDNTALYGVLGAFLTLVTSVILAIANNNRNNNRHNRHEQQDAGEGSVDHRLTVVEGTARVNEQNIADLNQDIRDRTREFNDSLGEIRQDIRRLEDRADKSGHRWGEPEQRPQARRDRAQKRQDQNPEETSDQ